MPAAAPPQVFVPADVPPLTAAAAAPPPAPARPSIEVDWEGAWQWLAGPLAGGGGPRDMAAAEARIGTVWFSRIGALLLVIGAVFAYRYGVTSDTLRTLIGYVAGAGLLGLGYWGHRRGYDVWSQAITGGGLGVLYLTTTAAAMYFSPAVIPQPVAFGLMCLITALATGLAVWYDAAAVGVLGLVGGFATPFLLSTGGGDFRVLFGYIVILDAGLLLVAYFKRWLLYNSLTFVATWGIYGLWRGQAFQAGDGPAGFLFATLFFLIFALVGITYNIVHREPSRPQDLALVVINGFVYFAAGLDLLTPGYTVLRGLFAFAVALAHFTLGLLTLSRSRGDRLLILAFLGLAGVFLTVAFPVALSGPWITVAWALEGAALVWVGFLAGAPAARRGGLAVLGLAAARLALWDTFPGFFGMPLPGPALRAFTFLAAAAGFYLAAGAFARFRGGTLPLAVLAAAGNLFTLWYITLEILLHYAGVPGAGARPFLAVSAAWGLYGLAVAVADLYFRNPGVRAGARVILTAALLLRAAGAPGLFGPAPAPAWLRVYADVAAVGSLWAAEWSIRRRGLDAAGNGVLSLVAGAGAFAGLALEVLLRLEPLLALPIGARPSLPVLYWQQSTRVFAVTAAWGAYALLTMAAGVWLRSSATRVLSAILLLVTLVFAGAAGAPNLAAAPGWRLAAFALAVPGAYLAAFLAARTPDLRPEHEKTAVTAAALGAALLTAWWGGAEVYAYFDVGRPAGATPLFAALAWVGFYALAVGHAGARLRAPGARWLAIGLQAVTLLGLLAALTGADSARWPFRLTLFVAAIPGAYAAHLAFRSPDQAPAEGRAMTWLSLAACALTVVWMGVELHQHFRSPLAGAARLRLQAEAVANHWVVLGMGLYGLAVTGAGLWLRSQQARVLGLGITTLAVAGALAAPAAAAARVPYALRLGAFVVAAGAAYAAAWLMHRFPGRAGNRERQAAQWLGLGTAALTVWWLTVQLQAYFSPFATTGSLAERSFARSTLDFGVSAAWGLYGLAVLVAGFALRHRRVRLLGLAVLALTLGKIGGLDMWRLAVQWRIWVTIGLGVVFVMASLLYHRFARLILGDDDREEGSA